MSRTAWASASSDRYPFIMMALVFLFPFTATGWMIPALMIFFGIVAGRLLRSALRRFRKSCLRLSWLVWDWASSF